MIRLANRIQESQIVGGPAWIYNDRFDIVAKSPQGALGQEFGLRMQSLLAQRFGLTLHRETQRAPCLRVDQQRQPKASTDGVDG